MRPPQPGFTDDEKSELAMTLSTARMTIASAADTFRDARTIYAVDKLRCTRRLRSAKRMLDRVLAYLEGEGGDKA